MFTLRASVALFFLVATLCVQGQQIINGVRVTELAVPTYQQEDEVYGVYMNAIETFLVMKHKSGAGRIQYRKNDGGTEWQDVDLKDIKGSLFKNDQPIESIIQRLTVLGRSFYSMNNDGLYFTTTGAYFGDCGGSYRIRGGKLETIVVTGKDLTFKGLDGKMVTKKVACATVAFPLGEDDLVIEVKPFGMLRKQGALFTQQFEVLIAELPKDQTLPYPYTFGHSIGDLGAWGDKSGLYFARVFEAGVPWINVTYFDFTSKKFTNLYKTSALNGKPVTSYSYANDPLTNERYFRLTTNDGRHHVVTISKGKGVEEIFNTSSAYPNLSGPANKVALWGSMSRQMALFGIMPDKTYDGIGIWRGNPTATEVLLQKGQSLPSGKTIELHNINPLNTQPLAVVGCTGLVPVYQTNSIRLNSLLEIKTPCITEYPTVSIEGSTVTLKGFDFKLGGDKVEVKLGTIGSTPAFDVSADKLSFGAPAICSDPCDVKIISGDYTSNIVRIKFERGPISQPEIKATTDLNGVVGHASPGKLMTLYGIYGCSVVTPIPIISPIPVVTNGVLRDDSPNGCKVLVDGTPVGLYFAWTGPDGSSQLNFLVPYGITEGNHVLTLQKTEVRNNTTSVIATSKPFPFKVESVNPTFFKPWNYDITLSAPPYATENGQPVYVSPTHPARPGDVLVAYLSGGGKTSPMLPERNAGTAKFLQEVQIWINDVPCAVLYAGTQNQYPGLEQINFQLPQSVRTEDGMATLKIKVGNSVKEFKINFEK